MKTIHRKNLWQHNSNSTSKIRQSKEQKRGIKGEANNKKEKKYEKYRQGMIYLLVFQKLLVKRKGCGKKKEQERIRP